MSQKGRGRFRPQRRAELEEVLTTACAEAFAAQAREERVSRRLLEVAEEIGDGRAGSPEVRGLLADLGHARADLTALRARITTLRHELEAQPQLR